MHHNKFKALLPNSSPIAKPFYWLISKTLDTGIYRRFARDYLSTVNLRLIGGPKFPVSRFTSIEQKIKARMSEEPGIAVYFGAYRGGLSWTVNHALSDCVWGHTGLIIKNHEDELETRNITSHGFKCEKLCDYVATLDDFAVGYFPMTADAQTMALARLERVMRAVASSQVDYDYSMNLEQKAMDFVEYGIPLPRGNVPLRLYCSEFTYMIVKDLSAEHTIKPTWVYDRYIVEPDTVATAAEMIFEEKYG